MVNTDKIRDLAKSKGIKLSYLSEKLGKHRTYINSVANGNSPMPDDRIHKVAELLNTTYDYLTDQTDDPDPRVFEKQTDTPQERLVHAVMNRAFTLSDEDAKLLADIFDSDDEDFAKILTVLKALRS